MQPIKSAYFLVLAVVIVTNLFMQIWVKGDRVIKIDVQGYYAYLPAFFIYHDMQFNFVDDESNPHHEEIKGDVWYNYLEDGTRIIQYTSGLAICYAPFFFVGHLGALLFGYPANGYSIPYDFMLQFGAILFFIMGLYYLRRILELYFSERTAALTLISVVLSTNLFYYITAEAAMSHVFSFAFIALFVWLLLKWLDRPNWQTTIQLGFVTGMVLLIRPSNIMIIALFVLMNVSRFSDIAARFRFFFRHYRQVLIMILAAFIVWIPQMIYWHSVTGHILFYSYGNDVGFFWGDPAIKEILFSYRKGWLLYTPVMSLALLGLIPLYRKRTGLFWSSLFVSVATIYVFGSWCFWWFGGSFGSRAFIDYYAIFAIPMAAFIDFVLKLKSKWWHRALYVLLFLFMSLNLFQIYQYRRGIIHWVSMTKEAYWSVFLKTQRPRGFDQMLEYPDYDGVIEQMLERHKDKED